VQFLLLKSASRRAGVRLLPLTLVVLVLSGCGVFSGHAATNPASSPAPAASSGPASAAAPVSVASGPAPPPVNASSTPGASPPSTLTTAPPPVAPTPPIESPPAIEAPPVGVSAVPTRHLRIALALGGGAARGFAHIGVIKALEARGIHPDIVVGTSAGSVVGALYAGGFDGIQLHRLAASMDEAALSDWSMNARGFFKGVSLQEYVNRVLKNRPIEKLDRRFAATATDLRTGQLVVFERGNTGLAVRASSSVPGVFQPVEINGHEYVDGGLVSPVPVRAARRLGADVVIAVDISARPANGNPSSIMGVLLQTFAIMGQTIGNYEMREADIVLIPTLPTMAGSDFEQRDGAVLAGEEVVALNAQRIKDVLEAKRRELDAQ
jgi:NTE family protein